MHTKKLKASSVSFILLSLFEIGLFLFYIISTNAQQGNRVLFSPSSILMIGFGAGCFLFSLYLLRVIKSNGFHIFVSAIKDYVLENRRYPKLHDVFSLMAVFPFVAGLFLWIQPARINDFLGEVFFVRLAQYFPVMLLCAALAFQCIYYVDFILPMKPSLKTRFRLEENWAVAVLLGLVCFLIYFVTSVLMGQLFTPKIAYFPELAEAFLDGRTYLLDPPSVKDLSLFNGKYYVSFPPLAALLMMPVVAMAGVDMTINTALWNNLVASFGVVFIFLALEQLRTRGWILLERGSNILLALFLGFGTVQYFMTIRGPVYYISQILTATLLSCSLWISLMNRPEKRTPVYLGNALLSGIVFSMAVLARPNVIFAFPALVTIQYQNIANIPNIVRKKMLTWLVVFLIPLMCAVSGLGWYNQIRFGSYFDFGYRNMIVVDPLLTADLQTYGQLNSHFMLRNINDNFLRLPYWHEECGLITPDPRGMSILITSPLLLYLLRSLAKKWWTAGFWTSIGAIILVHLMYFNSGALQFGYRFSLDFLPLAVLLLPTSFKERLPRIAIVLLSVSVAINFIGALWISRLWCVNW